MNNLTNITKYKLLAPVYDTFMGNQLFRKSRIKAFSLLQLKAKQQVLLVGVGTGEDIILLPKDVNIVGIDTSEAMLEKAREKAKGSPKILRNMNAEKLEFADKTFDAVVLNLILSVVENPQKAMLEAVRVLRDNRKIVVFDKFLTDNTKPSFARKLLNLIRGCLTAAI